MGRNWSPFWGTLFGKPQSIFKEKHRQNLRLRILRLFLRQVSRRNVHFFDGDAHFFDGDVHLFEARRWFLDTRRPRMCAFTFLIGVKPCVLELRV